MRFPSAILFILMAMVLPMAGVQQRFCTLSKAAACGLELCSGEDSHCCGEQGGHDVGEPACVTSAKNLPAAQKPSSVEVPVFESGWVLVPATLENFRPPLDSGHTSPERERGPPDRPRLFLTQLRLRI